MTIQVTSNTEVTPATATEATAVVENKSAPVANAAEQNESTESETEENEETEGTEDAEAETEVEADASEKDKPKKKGGFQRRIDKLNARYAAKDAESTAKDAEIEHWKQQALKGAGATKQDSAVETKTATAVEGKPRPEDFETHEAWLDAATDWKFDQRDKAKEQDRNKTALITEQEKLRQSHRERVKAFTEKHDDFAEAMEAVDDIPASAAVQAAIIESENGPALMYALAKDREEFERICKLSPLAAARALGMIEAKIDAPSTEKKTEPKKTTNAPKPIETVGSGRGSSSTKSIYDPSLSQSEYERLRREQMKRKQA